MDDAHNRHDHQKAVANRLVAAEATAEEAKAAIQVHHLLGASLSVCPLYLIGHHIAWPSQCLAITLHSNGLVLEVELDITAGGLVESRPGDWPDRGADRHQRVSSSHWTVASCVNE